jgi:precorrin-3B C17-methyltransferase
VDAICASDVIVGYRRYLELIADLIPDKDVISSGMTQERQRCALAVEKARAGHTVALISSGDSGIYGMAGLALELADQAAPDLAVEIIPGITSASASAAVMGAPLMLDFAVISLSDLLIPWETIRARLEAVAAADLVVTLYNPRSTKRTWQLTEALDIFRRHRPLSTPVGIGTAVGAPDETVVITDLEHAGEFPVTMRSVVIVGNGSSRIVSGRFVTPRGYDV